MTAFKLPACLRPIKLFAVVLMALLGACADMGVLAPERAMMGANTLYQSAGADSEYLSSQQWWLAFNDPQLNALVAEALSANPFLAVVTSRAQQAQAMAEELVTGQGLLVTGGVRAQGIHAPETILGNGQGDSFRVTQSLAINASYHWDLWGEDQSAWFAALGRQQAAQIDIQAARLSLGAELVSTYVLLAYAFDAKQVATSALSIADTREHLTALRVSSGIDSNDALLQTQLVVGSARQGLLQAENLIEGLRVRLAVLAGKGPNWSRDIEPPAVLIEQLTAQLGQLPDVIPADLLGRRPDVVASRMRVEAAAHDIDAAKARFYPSFDLTSAAGLAALHTEDLLSLPSRFYAVIPAVSLPVFDAPRLRASLFRRNTDHDLAVSTYNETLVNAVNEVADAIKRVRSLSGQARLQQQATQKASKSLALAVQRYDQGVENYLSVLDGQQVLLANQTALTQIQQYQITTSIQLIQILGGGYQEAEAAELSITKSRPITKVSQ